METYYEPTKWDNNLDTHFPHNLQTGGWRVYISISAKRLEIDENCQQKALQEPIGWLWTDAANNFCIFRKVNKSATEDRAKFEGSPSDLITIVVMALYNESIKTEKLWTTGTRSVGSRGITVSITYLFTNLPEVASDVISGTAKKDVSTYLNVKFKRSTSNHDSGLAQD